MQWGKHPACHGLTEVLPWTHGSYEKIASWKLTPLFESVVSILLAKWGKHPACHFSQGIDRKPPNLSLGTNGPKLRFRIASWEDRKLEALEAYATL